jgi:hypothetical protein
MISRSCESFTPRSSGAAFDPAYRAAPVRDLGDCGPPSKLRMIDA